MVRQSGRRRARREFEIVAAEAVRQAETLDLVQPYQEQKLIAALNRPRHREQIRSAFIGQLSPEALSVAEVAGKVDFDKLFEELTSFFPKLVTAKKFAPLLKIIFGLTT